MVSMEHDTNPAMVPAYRDGIWRSLLEPSYTLKRAGGAYELSAGLAFQIARSSNQTLSRNREDPNVFLDWRRQSNTGEFGLSARYNEVSTRVAEIDNTLPGFVDSTRASRKMSGTWSKALSERSTLSADGSYEGVSYKGGTYIDYATRSGGLKLSHALSEGSTTFLGVSNVKYVPDGGGPTSRLVNATLGWNWKVSDYLEGTLQAGKSKDSSTMMSKHGAASVQYTGRRTQLALNADRHTSSSGLGGFVTADQVNGRWSYDLSEYSRTGINAGWRKNRTIADDVSRSTDVWWQRDLSPFWTMRAHCLHRIREGGGAGGASSNILGFSFVYTNSDF